LGNKIKELRNSRITQKDFIDIEGVSLAYINKKEEKRQPTFRIITLIANALSVSTDELL
jgi:transcriptional regulator with XRE-family HTH domain